MKKVLATILAVAMILSLGVTAFAAQRVDSDGSLGTSVGEQAAFTEDTNTGATTFSIVDKSATVPTYQVSVTVPLTVTFCAHEHTLHTHSIKASTFLFFIFIFILYLH